jgi:hypothetical protein
VQRHDPCHYRRKRFRNPGIAHIGNVIFPVYGELVNFRMECSQYLACRSGKIDRHAARIHRVHRETAGAQPFGDCLDILRRRPVQPAELEPRSAICENRAKWNRIVDR